MERTEALKTLRLDPGADGRMVESAYWSLVRGAQERGHHDIEAVHEIDQLNEAYTALRPEFPRAQPAPSRQVQESAGLELIDAMADWLAEEGLRTRERWSHRNPEIALVAGAALVLLVLAVGAGASLLVTFIAAAAAFAGVWAPWRHPQCTTRGRERPR